MSVTPQDFFSYAEKILGDADESDEMAYRTAIRLGYYAVYHWCREIRDGLIPESDRVTHVGKHEALIQDLQGYNRGRDQEIDKLVQTFKRWRSERTNADYELNKEFDNKNAQAFLDEVKKRKTEIIDPLLKRART
ncbi:MAG: hypothetical protein SVR94_08615 [Pseudomonadota bacterium]|nr:hypothetical protein [Pseudomonadota bacterium]